MRFSKFLSGLIFKRKIFCKIEPTSLFGENLEIFRNLFEGTPFLKLTTPSFSLAKNLRFSEISLKGISFYKIHPLLFMVKN